MIVGVTFLQVAESDPGSPRCSTETVSQFENDTKIGPQLVEEQVRKECTPSDSLSYAGLALIVIGGFLTLPAFLRLLPDDSSLSTPIASASRGKGDGAGFGAEESLEQTQLMIKRLRQAGSL